MSIEQIQVGKAQANWNAAGTKILKYSLEMYHRGLNEHKVITAPDIDILQNKANLQALKWTENWNIAENKRKITETKENNIEKANMLTSEAETAIKDIDNILLFTLTINDEINWEKLKRSEVFSEKQIKKPIDKKKEQYPNEPIKEKYQFNIFENIFKKLKQKKIDNYDKLYKEKHDKWIDNKKIVDENNKKIEIENEKTQKQYQNDVKEWELRKEKFINEQNDFNTKIDNMKSAYLSCDTDAVTEYCDLVLNNSIYPSTFPKNFEIEYNSDNKIVIVEYQLPSLENFPKIKEVKYVASKFELKESYLPENQITKMFDSTMFKIALRSIHELFEADTAHAIEAISFNGWVKAINKATGNEENNCILSIQVKKEEFEKIDLKNVDPKICFKNLKGVSSSKLSTLTPIQPILQISRVDKRFIESYEVANNIDNTTNLAAMDWEDFEHLIRELFEKEFKSNGGEVKITQASRDGGVDAVAFDPDPIRGGKIVIQAKRYTNTVGVSAVRDLYGTTLNEGATKGILVSTADYGADAYEFAKGKPLTLLNGSNLLHLLEKHGHHAKIDLREAKKILNEKNNL